jgi:hypothetical protein
MNAIFLRHFFNNKNAGHCCGLAIVNETFKILSSSTFTHFGRGKFLQKPVSAKIGCLTCCVKDKYNEKWRVCLKSQIRIIHLLLPLSLLEQRLRVTQQKRKIITFLCQDENLRLSLE